MKRPTALLLGLVLAGCGAANGGRVRPPATLPADALPGLHARSRSLDPSALAADAGVPALQGLLEGAGFVVGSEREFSGRTRTFNHVVARVLLFRDPGGASTYLDWVRSHPKVTLGTAVPGKAPAIGESPVLFALGPCGCHAQVPASLVAWRRGSAVFWLLAAGSGATREAVVALARELDRAGSG